MVATLIGKTNNKGELVPKQRHKIGLDCKIIQERTTRLLSQGKLIQKRINQKRNNKKITLILVRNKEAKQIRRSQLISK